MAGDLLITYRICYIISCLYTCLASPDPEPCPPSGNPAFPLKKAPGTYVSGAGIYIEKVLVYRSSFSISSVVPSE